MSYDALQIYGIAITADETRISSINLLSDESRISGFHINANNFFQGDILVSDTSGEIIVGASISITGNGTNLSGTTNSEGIFNIQGIETINTNLSIQASGFHAYQGPMPTNVSDGGITIALKEQVIQRVKVTNRGNIMINPNDGILIELD